MNNQVKQIGEARFRLKVHKAKCIPCDMIVLVEAPIHFKDPSYSCPNCSDEMEVMDHLTIVQESDTPPVPTIKPGDKVRHVRRGVGIVVDSYGSKTVADFDDGLFEVLNRELEVVE